MALDKQVIPIAIGQGLDTKTDPKKVIPGKLLVAENMVFTTPGLLKKRNGFESFSKSIVGSTSTIDTGSALANYKSELLVFSGSELYSRSSSTDNFSDKGSGTSINLSINPIVRNAYAQTTPDSAYHSIGLKLFTWEDSRGGSRYSIVDVNTGMFIANDQVLLSTAVTPKPFVLGNYFVIIYRDTASNNLRFKTISVLSPTVLNAAADIANDYSSGTPLYDATIIGSRLFVAYNNVAGTHITGRYVNEALAVSAGVTLNAEIATTCLTVVGDETLQRMWVGYYNGSAVASLVRDYSLNSVFGAFIVQSVASVVRITGYADNSLGNYYYEISDASTYFHQLVKASLNDSGTVFSADILLKTVGLASKAFIYDGIQYVTVTHDSTLQPTYFVINSSGKVVAKISPSTGGGLTTKSILPEVVSLEDGIFSFASLIKDLFTTISGAVYTQTGVLDSKLDFMSNLTYQNVQLANNLHVSGGILSMYDGAALVEHGFHLYPENILATPAGSGGSLSAGQYQFSVCYEWTDSQGQIHRSAPSIPSTVTAVANDSVQLIIPTLCVTSKQGSVSPISIVVYRTEVNGSIFYRDSSITSPTINSTGVNSVSFTSTQADSALIGNPLLYTTGGVVENIAAPATDLVTTYRNRVIAVPSEDKLSYWYSKQAVPGTPIEFSDLFVQKIDPRGGDITAVAPMDDKLIIFKNNSIFLSVGEGPDSAGANNDFTEAQLITTDGGSITPYVGVTPIGLMYKSEKGIYLLDRSLQARYIGAPVEQFNSGNLTSINLIPNTNQVRFTIDTGVALVYDYFVNEWSVFTNVDAVSAVIFDGEFTYLKSSGLVLQETPGSYTDDGAFIKMRFVTSWLSFAQLQGFQRAYRLMILGNYVSKHRLMVQVGYDFNPNYTQQTYIDAGTLLDQGTYGDSSPYGDQEVYGGYYPTYEFQVNLSQQKCTSFQISIEDVAEQPYGEGMSISSIGLVVGGKKGLQKLPASRRFG